MNPCLRACVRVFRARFAARETTCVCRGPRPSGGAVVASIRDRRDQGSARAAQRHRRLVAQPRGVEGQHTQSRRAISSLAYRGAASHGRDRAQAELGIVVGASQLVAVGATRRSAGARGTSKGADVRAAELAALARARSR
eukprot:5444511-Pleurochrysis_carterae.AAC.2